MGRAWDISAIHRSSVDEAASVDLQLPKTACNFIRVQVRWTQVCAEGRSQKNRKTMNSGLEPLRAPHVAAQATNRSEIVDNHRASEWQDASDVQTPSPNATDDRLPSSIAARSNTSPARRDFFKLPKTTGRSATRAAIADSIDCNRSGTVVACNSGFLASHRLRRSND